MEQTPNNPEINPIPPTTEPVPVSTPPPVHPRRKLSPLLIVVILAVCGMIIGAIAAQIGKSAGQQTITPIPTFTPGPSPTPIRPETEIATTSAFLDLNQRVSDLKAKINEYNPNDQSLTPPVLDLPLGFPAR